MKFTDSFAMNHADAIEIVVGLLDGFKAEYRKLSDNRASNYLDYLALEVVDEESFVQPKFVPALLTRLLGYRQADYVPEYRGTAGPKRPDFVPADIGANPYVIEAKGSDADYAGLRRYKKQALVYCEKWGVQYAILINPREILVLNAKTNLWI